MKKVYTPESLLKNPVKLFSDIVRDLSTASNIGKKLAFRDIKSQYRQTLLGYFWAILPPLATSMTFLILNRSSIMSIQSSSMPYPVFVFSGTIFWQLFVDSINIPLKVMNQNKSMISKINFPKESLLISGLIQIIFSFLIKLILLAGIIIYFGSSLKLSSSLAIIPLCALSCFGFAMGIFFVPIGVLFQDIEKALNVIMPALMLLTPVVYYPETNGILSLINNFNPIAPLIMGSRDILFSSNFMYFDDSSIFLAFSTLLLMISIFIYRSTMPHLIERMDA